MNSFKNHLTIIENTVSKYPSSPAFKVPRVNPRTGRVREWQTITYQEFQQNIELFAKYWSHVLKSRDILQRSIVGVWLGGTTYIDALHVYGITRAGYVPQLFSLRLPSPSVIYELLRKANAKALIYDASYESIIKESPVPIFLAVNAKDADGIDGPLPDFPVVNGDDMVYLLHTSGSTSGTPKLVPWTYSWLDNAAEKAVQSITYHDLGRKMVCNWVGSVCHAGQHFVFLGHLEAGGCMIQPTTINFPTEELFDMVERCGLNCLLQMGSYLSERLRRSRHDPKLLSLLRGLSDISYGGLPISREAEEWAQQNDIKTAPIFSSTECGCQLVPVTRGASPILFRALEGVSFEFRPVTLENDEDPEHQSGPKLLELIVLSDSPDCPHPSLRHPDGHFHTGDLFEEVNPGQYISRGRNDDWIKTENGLRCDTKAIENNVGTTCSHLVAEYVVVGYGRPSPTLFVEPAVDMDHELLKKEIIQATRPFNSRRYLHEQIISEKMVVVVPPKALPRTAAKGNIRRKAVEDAYKAQLDAIYASV